MGRRGLKGLRGIGGAVDPQKVICQIFILTFFADNLITGISTGKPMGYYLSYCLPFLIIPLVLQFIRNKKIFSFIYLLLSLAMMITGTMGNFSGMVYLIFSIYLYKSFKYEIISLSLATLAISTNAFIHDLLPSQLFIMLRVYAFTYLIYFFTIRSDQKKHDSPDVTIPDIYISPDEKHLIELLFSGNTRQEIYSIMGKSKTSINSYQNNLLVKLQAKTFEEVLLKLGKSVKIKENSQDADK